MADTQSVSAVVALTCTVTETVGTTPSAASTGTGATVVHDQFNYSATLTGASSPAATKVAGFDLALSGGAATIDLTALTGTNGGTINGTGLRVEVFKVKALETNSNPLTFAVGASNGYDLMGADTSVTLLPGQQVMFLGNDAAPSIGSGDKTIDFTGTLAEGAEVMVLMG